MRGTACNYTAALKFRNAESAVIDETVAAVHAALTEDELEGIVEVLVSPQRR